MNFWIGLLGSEGICPVSEKFDIAIVGAGMAGASLAAEIGRGARTVLLEAEDRPGRHATGRSAAFWVQTYGGPLIEPLTTASGPWLAEHGFLADRGGLTIARAGQEAQLEAFVSRFAGSRIEILRLDRPSLDELIPGLHEDWVGGVFEPSCMDIDVGGLHAWYLAEAKRAGSELRPRASLVAAEWDGLWHLKAADGSSLTAEILVNAAGAWADTVAQMAGIAPLGITPLRRTIAQVRTSPAPRPTMPLVLDVDGKFYFKPESGRLWISPHDETPSAPCDAAPEELDVALAIERLEGVVDWKVERVEHKWAGLRSFAPDRLPVYGPAEANPAFFWFAGQGGFGIQTAPAAARLAAQMLLGLPADNMTAPVDRERYTAARFA